MTILMLYRRSHRVLDYTGRALSFFIVRCDSQRNVCVNTVSTGKIAFDSLQSSIILSGETCASPSEPSDRLDLLVLLRKASHSGRDL